MVYPALLVFFSTILAVIVMEIILRILNIGFGNAPLESHEIFHHVHPSNYRFISHTPTGEYGGHEIYYDQNRLITNPEGSSLSD